MFEGMPTDMRAIVREHARMWPAGSDVYIGHSGNLTIERSLAGLGFRLHSGDETPVGCALGWHFAGQRLAFAVKQDSLQDLEWLEAYLDGGAGTAAAVMLGAHFLDWVGSGASYHLRIVTAYRDQFPKLHAKTVAKLEAATLKLADFYPGDVREHLGRAPAGAPVAVFPTLGGGRESGEATRGINAHLDWPEPEPTPKLDEDGRAELIESVTDRPYWLLGLPYLDPTLEEFRVGYVQPRPRAPQMWVYARPGRYRMVGPHTQADPIAMPKIGPGDEMGGRLALHQLTGAQFAGLRAMYLDKRIAPATPDLAVGVSCDGLLIGAFALRNPLVHSGPAYLLSDFPIGWTRYRRLSKLIVFAALSAEAQLLWQRHMSRRVTMLMTTAFSNRPNASKYQRGVPGMRLYKRTKLPEGSEHAYQLQYEAPLGQWDLAKALGMWKRFHSEDQFAWAGGPAGQMEDSRP